MNNLDNKMIETEKNIIWNIRNRRDLLPIIMKTFHSYKLFEGIFESFDLVMNDEIKPNEIYNEETERYLLWFGYEYSTHLKVKGFGPEDKRFLGDLIELVTNYQAMTESRKLENLLVELKYNLIIPTFERLIQAGELMADKMQTITNRVTPMQELSKTLNEAVMDKYEKGMSHKSAEYTNIIKDNK